MAKMKMYNEARDRWNERYSKRDTTDCDACVLEPDTFISNNIRLLKEGSVLDIACGDGRNAIYLAKEGFDVKGVDISPVGLERLKTFATEAEVTVETEEMDLTDNNVADKLLSFGKVDNVIIIRFKASDKILDVIPSLLTDEGVFILCSFNCRSIDKGFDRQFCFEEGELKDRYPDLKLIKFETFENTKGFLDAYIFKKEI